MFAKQFYLGLAIVSVAAAAQAGAGNPLQPNFYWNSAPEVQAVTSGATQYIDSRNPLNPAYAHAMFDTTWQPAAYSMGPGNRDSGNPLHPSFTR